MLSCISRSERGFASPGDPKWGFPSSLAPDTEGTLTRLPLRWLTLLDQGNGKVP